MNEKTLVRVSLFLKKVRLIKFGRYIFRIYTNHSTKIIEKKQIIEIRKFGRYAEVKIGNYKLILDRQALHDFQMLKILESGGIYEPEVSSYITKNLQIGENFIDIGANNGYYSILAADLVGPNGKVISVEPNPKAFQRLLHNIKINNPSNIIPLNVALSDHEGFATLYSNNDSDDGSASLAKGFQIRPLMQVELKRFDQLFKDENINMIKMDVEGAEIVIIRGGLEDYIRSHKDIKIIMEWNPSYRTKNDFNYLSSLFHINLLLPDKELGFKIKEITEFKELFMLCNLLLEAKN